MEIGPVTRPGLPNGGAASRIAPGAVAAPVRAELPRTAVEQVPGAAKAGPDLPPRTGRGGTIDRRLEIDPATRQVVYQVVETTSGEIVRQVPDEALMRLRAYARALRQAESGKGVEAGRIA